MWVWYGGLVRLFPAWVAVQLSDWFSAIEVAQCPVSAEAGGCCVELAAL